MPQQDFSTSALVTFWASLLRMGLLFIVGRGAASLASPHLMSVAPPLPTSMTIKNIYRHHQMIPGGGGGQIGKTAPVENHCVTAIRPEPLEGKDGASDF